MGYCEYGIPLEEAGVGYVMQPFRNPIVLNLSHADLFWVMEA